MLRNSAAALRLAHTLRHLDNLQRALGAGRSHYDPNQPRVPAGHSDGGQWTRVGAGRTASTAPGEHSSSGSPDGMSDAGHDPIRPGAQYAQNMTQVDIDPQVYTGIERIDNATKSLIGILKQTIDLVPRTLGQAPAVYGTAIHGLFASAVKSGKIPGIGFWDVETTFSLLPDARYGSKGSIRTDVVLRNEAGEIIAIYDVKTGERGLSPARVREIRKKTGVGPGVPIIELNVIRASRAIWSGRQVWLKVGVA
jgi:hypothetical protein